MINNLALLVIILMKLWWNVEMIFDLQSTLKLSFSLVVSHFQQLHISAIKTIPKQREKKEQLDEKGGGGGGGRGGWRRRKSS